MKNTTALILFLLLFSPLAQAKECGLQDAEAADMAVDTLNSWSAVKENFIRYGHCDSGSIAEGNSEVISRLLVDNWNELPQLNNLVSHNAAFRSYILKHIDSTLDTQDLDKIIRLSRSSCAQANEELCAAIQRAATQAEK